MGIQLPLFTLTSSAAVIHTGSVPLEMLSSLKYNSHNLKDMNIGEINVCLLVK